MIARLFRVIPLFIFLAIIAVILYFVVSYRYSPNRAKELLIAWFSWIMGALSIFFGLASLYALLETNDNVLEFTGSFFAVGAVAFIVVRISRAVFLKHNPHYRKNPVKASRKRRIP